MPDSRDRVFHDTLPDLPKLKKIHLLAGLIITMATRPGFNLNFNIATPH